MVWAYEIRPRFDMNDTLVFLQDCKIYSRAMLALNTVTSTEENVFISSAAECISNIGNILSLTAAMYESKVLIAHYG